MYQYTIQPINVAMYEYTSFQSVPYTHSHVSGCKIEQITVCKCTRNDTLQYECTFKLDRVYNKFKLDGFQNAQY